MKRKYLTASLVYTSYVKIIAPNGFLRLPTYVGIIIDALHPVHSCLCLYDRCSRYKYVWVRGIGAIISIYIFVQILTTIWILPSVCRVFLYCWYVVLNAYYLVLRKGLPRIYLNVIGEREQSLQYTVLGQIFRRLLLSSS